MTVPVLTAVTDAGWEADLVAALGRIDTGIHVARRCVDLPDLLAIAATGVARVALVAADLRGLDGEALTRLTASRVRVVVLVNPGDDPAERRMRQLGLAAVLPATASPAEIAAAVVALDGSAGADPVGGAPAHSYAFSATDAPGPVPAGPAAPASAASSAPAGDEQPVSGLLVAVWGPTGAPGRTTIAAGVAGELAHQGVSTLLADADVYGGVLAQVLGVLDDAPGVAAAARMANAGTLDVAALASVARTVSPRLRLLSGLNRADRWPELRPSAVSAVWSAARRLAEVTVVDCGFSLEQDEELIYDTAAPRRNGATLTTLEMADRVLVVGSADPVGLQRLIRGLSELGEVLPASTSVVVVNRLRTGVVPGNPDRQVRAALERFAAVTDVVAVPYDRSGFDAALAGGRQLREVAPNSPARRALAELAASIVGRPPPPTGRRLRGRR